MTLDTLNSPAVTETLIPNRTRLHCIVPIGIGTELVESVASYIHRLAASHCIPTWALIIRIVAPLFQRETVVTAGGHCDLFGPMGATISGNNETAAETLGILQELTGGSELHKMNLLNLGNAVDGPLIRPYQAWCPTCLNEWRSTGRDAYQKLLWSIRHVEVCPSHKIQLQSACPWCGRKHRPLTRYYWDGHCPRCNGWLGQIESGPDTSTFWALQLSREMETALTRLQSRSSPITSSIFPRNVERLTATVFGGRTSRLAKTLRVHHTTVSSWVEGSQRPSLSSLGDFSCTFGIPMTDWIETDVDLSRISLPSVFRDHKNPLRKHNLNHIESKLREILREDVEPPRYLAEICRELGADESFVARKFPEIARTLIERRRQYQSIKREVETRFTPFLIQATFNKLIVEGVRPTLSQMSKALPKGISLRNPTVRAEVDRLRQELESEFRDLQTEHSRSAMRAARNHNVAADRKEP